MSEVVEAPSRPAGRNYVAGEWRPAASGDTYEKRSPMRPSEVVATVAVAVVNLLATCALRKRSHE